MILVLLPCALAACGPSARQLTPKEATVLVLSEEKEAEGQSYTPMLKEECQLMGSATRAPTSEGMSFAQDVRAFVPGSMACAPGLDTADDLRRCAGEHQAQAVQIVGSNQKKLHPNTKEALGKLADDLSKSPAFRNHWPDLRRASDELAGQAAEEREIQQRQASAERDPGAMGPMDIRVPLVVTMEDGSVEKLEMSLMDLVHLDLRLMTAEDHEKYEWALRDLSQILADIAMAQQAEKGLIVWRDLLFWSCPVSRAVPAKGELVPHRHSGNTLQLLRDGQVVMKDFTPSELPRLVEDYPPAAELAARAAARERAMVIRAYVSVPFALLAVGGASLAVVGAVKHDPWFTYGGAGGAVLFTGVAVGVVLSGRKPHFEAMTMGLTAIERYNDEHIRGDKP